MLQLRNEAPQAALTRLRWARRGGNRQLGQSAEFEVAGTHAQRNRYYEGPKSDHFDGERFFNSSGAVPRPLHRSAALAVGGGRAAWPRRWPSPYPPAVPRRGLAAASSGHHGRPCDAARATRRPQHPDRSGVVGARLAVLLARAEAGQRRPALLFVPAAHRRGAGQPQSLRSSRPADPRGVARALRPAGADPARQRHDDPASRARHAGRGA